MSREETYLNTVRAKTGKDLLDFTRLASERGYDEPDVKPAVIMAWLKSEFGLGHGHATALMHAMRARFVQGEQ